MPSRVQIADRIYQRFFESHYTNCEILIDELTSTEGSRWLKKMPNAVANTVIAKKIKSGQTQVNNVQPILVVGHTGLPRRSHPILVIDPSTCD